MRLGSATQKPRRLASWEVSPTTQQDTFLHEVFHAIVHVMDLKETETEENYVRRLATGLCTVWNNNPAAFKWWRGLV